MQLAKVTRILYLSCFALAAASGLARAQCCIEPTSETSKFVYRVEAPQSAFPTLSAFQQTVSDSNGDNLNGLGVREGTPIPDSNPCHGVGAPFAPTSSVSGGTWVIGAPDPYGSSTNGINQYGSDVVGIPPGFIDWIRANIPLPCTIMVPQTMYSSTTCNPAYARPYFSDTQTITINASTVTNCRAGVCDAPINY